MAWQNVLREHIVLAQGKSVYRRNRAPPAGGICLGKLVWLQAAHPHQRAQVSWPGFYHRVLPLESATFRDRLAFVERRIEEALQRSGRQRSEVRLVAVSKKFSASHIREAYAAGLREFGENYVQEFREKKPGLPDLPDARYHLIGHLQSNKARLACELFDVVETVDSPRILERLNACSERKKIEVWFEIKLSDEASKTGAPPEEIPALLSAAQQCPRLQVAGLMTIPPWSEDPEVSRPYFRRLAELGREHGLQQLSIGMSNDFEAAIEEGATLIRVGTALFGPRPKAKSPALSTP
jgi:PLP dependent protein